MADWTGAGRDTVDVYRKMAERELRGISPSYEQLCLAVADDERLCSLLDRLPEPKRQPILLLASVRYLDGPVDRPGAFLDFVRLRWDDITQVMLEHRVQTNEAARCATLLPVLAALPQPLSLIEVGASAGLCLYPDRYAYRYRAASGDHKVGTSAVVLACAVTGAAPLPSTLPQVAWRAGIDLNPLHADRADDRRWLECLVWPEHTERASRLEQALDLVAADPPRIDTGDLLTDLPKLVADAPSDTTVVVFHTAVLAYVPPPARDEFTRLMQRLRDTRDVHWISNEVPGIVAGTDLHIGPPARCVLAHNQRPLALAGPHGQSLDWI
ncbi:hypothetical protein SAMN05444157_3554 [Frankineae bacterium MT45]|nr:hypothetical protein SAMN05444157_3554 [Frankineae bacterium MT45]